MPPRYVYWTILIDNKPTAFRAREKEDLLPTLAQLRRTNAEVVLKWFARGRIWDSPEAEQEAQKRPPVTGDKRGHDWRPGGMHKDPRDRFKKKPGGPKGDRPPSQMSHTSQKPPSFAPRFCRARQFAAERPPGDNICWRFALSGRWMASCSGCRRGGDISGTGGGIQHDR